MPEEETGAESALNAEASDADSKALPEAEHADEIKDRSETETVDEIEEPRAPSDAPETPTEPTAPAASDDETDTAENAALAAHPMFAYFAEGRQESFPALCRAFRKMLAAGGNAPKEVPAAARAKMTPPSDGAVVPESGLSERQRMLARRAGMSYREYKALMDEIPNAARSGKK